MKPIEALIACLCVLMVCLTAIYVTDRLTSRDRERPKGSREPRATSYEQKPGTRNLQPGTRNLATSPAAAPSPQPAAQAPAPALPPDAPWGVGIASTMTKVFRDEPFRGPAARQAEVALARGEIEGVQLVLLAQKQDLKDVTVTLSALRGEAPPRADWRPVGGGRLAPAVAWSLVGYIETKGDRPYWTDKVGWWPDPLLPPQRFSVAKGEAQPLWLNVQAAAATPPGLYRGAVTIAPANAEPWTVDLSVRVWNFAVPRTGHLKTMCWMDSGPILRFYGLGGVEEPGALDAVKAYAELALRNRLAPGGSLACGFSWAKPQWPVRKTADGYDFSQAEDLLRFAVDRGMNCFLLAVIPNLKRTGWPSYSDQWKADFKDLVASYARFLRERDFLKYAYVYNFDEAPKVYWDVVKENYRMVKAIDPSLRVIQCLNEPEGVKALAGFADTWDVYVAQYDQTGVADRQRAGDEAWWAVCIYPKDHPNFFIDYPALDERIIGWLSWKYRMSGFEYWSIDSWEKENIDGEGGKKWPDVPWKSKQFAGEGFLCYPGPDRKPLSSVRFENLRDGFEDYEYLWLLREKLPRLGEADRAAAEKLLALEVPLAEAPLAQSNAVYTDDPKVILAHRAAIAALLEK